uniref:Large ribosomal subunit protein uL22m n=1 Tax=Panagrolaimus sp. JU765 TaxID=591449 RepID=A0AC34QKI5_9BILA
MLAWRRFDPRVLFRGSFASYSSSTKDVVPSTPVSAVKQWKKREQFTQSKIQRFEEQAPKNYYAPEWQIEQTDDKGRTLSPLKNCGVTPEKWKYYNQVVWSPNHVVPETGLPKAREIFHVRESIHYQPKKIWPACQFVRGFNVDYAIEQLRFKQKKNCLLLAEILEEAKERAKKEFHIAEPGKMFVAEAFPVQSSIVKGARRHARENWCVIRYRYIHVFVRLEEGEPRNINTRLRMPDGWEKMANHYSYLRSRDFKYSI